MDFCPKCGSLLTPQKNKQGQGRILVCPSCGHTQPLSPKGGETYRVVDKIGHQPSEETVVVTDEIAQQQTMPTVRQVCPKCGNNVAYYWQVQTRAGDEGMTTFYRCVKCGQTWREY
jgi:DNA-directed RNA polymerase subunit M